jgi:hypothetical protein
MVLKTASRTRNPVKTLDRGRWLTARRDRENTERGRLTICVVKASNLDVRRTAPAGKGQALPARGETDRKRANPITTTITSEGAAALVKPISLLVRIRNAKMPGKGRSLGRNNGDQEWTAVRTIKGRWVHRRREPTNGSPCRRRMDVAKCGRRKDQETGNVSTTLGVARNPKAAATLTRDRAISVRAIPKRSHRRRTALDLPRIVAEENGRPCAPGHLVRRVQTRDQDSRGIVRRRKTSTDSPVAGVIAVR